MPRFLSDYEAARAQGLLWTPFQLKTLPYFWADAWDLSVQTIGSGNAVSSVADKAESGRLLNAPSGAEPVLDRDKQCWSMPHDTLRRFMAEGTAWPLTAWDAFIVNTAPASYTTYRPFIVTNALGDSQYALIGQGGANTLAAFVTGYLAYGSLTWVPDRAGLIYLRATSVTDLSLALDGSVTLTADGGVTLTNLKIITIGNEQANVAAGIGDLHSFILTPPVSAPDRQRIEGYQAWALDMARGGTWTFRSALSAANPYRNKPPIIGQ